MVDAHDPNGGDDELAPRHVLEALAVPELPYDFTDRVMGSLQAAALPRVPPPQPVLPWLVAGCAGVVALAATLVAVVAKPPEVVPPTPVVATAPTETIAVASPPIAATTAPLLGHLVLTVTPVGATVRIDGALIVGPSPFIATNLVPGRHTIAVEHEDCTPWTREVDLPVGQLAMTIELAPHPELVPVVELPTPDPRSSKTPRLRGSPVPDLKDPFSPTGEVPPAPEEPPAPEVAPGDAVPDMKNPFGDRTVLRIGTNAGVGAAQVYVDGKLVGTTPLGDVRVSPGRHKVKWRWPDGREVTQSVEIDAGKTRLMKAG